MFVGLCKNICVACVNVKLKETGMGDEKRKENILNLRGYLF